MHNILFIITTAGIIAFIATQRHKERMTLIEKGLYHPDKTTKPPFSLNSTALLFGLMSAAVGVALLLGGLLGDESHAEFMTAGLICAFSGASLLVYWKVTARERKDIIDRYTEIMNQYYRHPSDQNITDERR